jgi:hypothetical protein
MIGEAQFDRFREPWVIKFVPDTLFHFSRSSVNMLEPTQVIEGQDIWSISVFPDRDTITLDLMTPSLSGPSLLTLGIDSADVVDLQGTVSESLKGDFFGVFDFIDATGGAERFVVNLGLFSFDPIPNGPDKIVFIHYYANEDGELHGFVAKGDVLFIDNGPAVDLGW